MTDSTIAVGSIVGCDTANIFKYEVLAIALDEAWLLDKDTLEKCSVPLARLHLWKDQLSIGDVYNDGDTELLWTATVKALFTLSDGTKSVAVEVQDAGKWSDARAYTVEDFLQVFPYGENGNPH